MAKFVIAGRCNCPYYAKAELVADQLARNLSNFSVCKIIKNVDEWEPWLNDICKRNSWKHTKSPIIWREVLDRGGKGKLIGDANDFQEYAKAYYGIDSKLTSYDLRKISAENEETLKIIEREQREVQERIKPIYITISHAASPVTYYIVSQILTGSIEGFDKDIKLKLYEKESSRALEGVKMEIEDLASNGLRNVEIETNEEKAFKQADLIILLDELENLNLEKHELKPPIIARYYNPFIQLAKSIDRYAKDSCKILITPIQSHSQIFGLVSTFVKNLKRLNKENVLGNSLYDELIAKSVLARRLRISSANIKDVVVIGQSIQESHYIDIAQGRVTGYDGAIWARPPTHWRTLVDMIADVEWMQKEFPLAVHNREKSIKDSLNRDAILTFSQSIVKLLELWLNVNNDDDMLHSAVVFAHGCYGVKDNMCLSLPVVFRSGKCYLKNHFKLTNEVTKIIEEIISETEVNLAEKFQDDIFNVLDTRTPEPTPLPRKAETETNTEEENKTDEHKNEETEIAKERELKVEFSEPPAEYSDEQMQEVPDEND